MSYEYEIVRPKLDIVFKKMFSDPKNIDLLRDFLSAVLDIPVESIQNIHIDNPEILPGEDINEKFCRLDIKMTVDNRIIDVEMQSSFEGDFVYRSLYYWAKLYAANLRKGHRYEELKPCICIFILNFNMFEDDEDFHSIYSCLNKKTRKALNDHMELHFCELKKLGKDINVNDHLKLWLQLINAEKKEDLDMIENTKIPIMEKAVMTVQEMSADERLRETARQREKALHIEASNLGAMWDQGWAKGRAEGWEKGKTEGRAEALAEIAEKLKFTGLSEDQIKQVLGI